MKVVLIPGWHERSRHMRTFADGRHGQDGLAAFGFDCTYFPTGHDALRPRVDRFAKFLDTLRTREPEAFPVATIGYSTGGLVNRGFLRAYPERAHEIAATVQIAAPNTGIVSNYIANMLRVMGIPNAVIRDLDVASEFLTWLNGTTGTWVPTEIPKKARWKLNATPWTVPAGHRVLCFAGRVPKYRIASDGVVRLDSSILEGHLPAIVFEDRGANHLNLGAVRSAVAFLARGFLSDDTLWPQIVKTTAAFLRGQRIALTHVPEGSIIT